MSKKEARTLGSFWFMSGLVLDNWPSFEVIKNPPIGTCVTFGPQAATALFSTIISFYFFSRIVFVIRAVEGEIRINELPWSWSRKLGTCAPFQSLI